MFCDISSHHLINTIHRRTLSVKHNDFSLNDSNVLPSVNLPSTARKNLYLGKEVYKALNQIGPLLMWSSSQVKTSGYSLRRGVNVDIPRIRKYIGLNSFDVRAAKRGIIYQIRLNVLPQWESLVNTYLVKYLLWLHFLSKELILISFLTFTKSKTL